MPPKRPRLENPDSSPSALPRPEKRRRRVSPAQPPQPYNTTSRDHITPLSDELLIRILSFLTHRQLIAVAPVSRRFHRLADDSQLWKSLYYARFVLPRALRVRGPRPGGPGRMLQDLKRPGRLLQDHRLHYKLWADGELLRDAVEDEHPAKRLKPHPWEPKSENDADERLDKEKEDRAHWKRQYKIRHNWAYGKCAVEELKLGPESETENAEQGYDSRGRPSRPSMLVKVVEGLAVTVDVKYGLRAWDLRTREVMAQLDLSDEPLATITSEYSASPPSCLAVDDGELERGTLDIVVGFVDGSFGVWQLSTRRRELVKRYRHAKSSNGALIAIAYCHPYLLTATKLDLASLYTFDVPEQNQAVGGVLIADANGSSGEIPTFNSRDTVSSKPATKRDPGSLLPAPYLLKSTRSQTSKAPLALSIRKTANTHLASIAHAFYPRAAWSVGIQDFLITPNANPKRAPRITSRWAYTAPTAVPSTHNPPRPPENLSSVVFPDPEDLQNGGWLLPAPRPPPPPPPPPPYGPTSLCYSHPYLLATLPDNTLSLYLCTATAATLSISPGIRLWGHTSGISNAEITARGKAVSVSSRGDEMRVWELEGRPDGVRSRSVEIRAAVGGKSASFGGSGEEDEGSSTVKQAGDDVDQWEERRNWVGFDNEMVIVLKEDRGGRESLLVYDFT